MMKRNNEGIGGESYSHGNHDDAHQKRRKVQFDAVKLPAVGNVNEMRSRTLVYQAAKLRQDTLYKNKRIAELERENERAKRRQQTDESNFVKVYNLFSNIEKFITAQVRNEFGVFYITEPALPTGVEVLGMPSESYNKFVEQAKLNLKNAFIAFGKARHDRQQENTSFMHQMRSLMDDPTINMNEIHKELIKKCGAYSLQIEKLQAEKTKVDDKIYNLERKKKEMIDKQTVAESKIQELEQQLQEQREETDRNLRLACKYEDRLAHIVSEFQSGKGVAQSSAGSSQAEKKMTAPATPPSEAAIREIENLRNERDEQAALAARRLHELEDMNRRNQQIAQENSKLKMELQTQPSVSIDAIHSSDEYKNLKKYYSVLMKEYDRVCKDLEEIVIERDKFRSAKEQRACCMAEEQAKTMKEFQLQTDIHNAFYRVTHDSEVLRCEFESVKEEYNKGVKQSEWDEMKSILNTLRSVNKSLKTVLERCRQKDEKYREEIRELKEEVEKMKELQYNSIWIPIERSEGETAEDGLEKENIRLRDHIRNMAASDVQQRNETIQEEVNRRIADKLQELDNLRTANENLTNDEQGLSCEYDNVLKLLEEEHEKNAQLFMEKREHEDRSLKIMNDRMVQNQVQNRLNEKVVSLENKAQTDAQIAKMHEFEKKTSEDIVNRLTENLQFKSTELTRITNLMEVHRKNVQEIGIAREEQKHRAESAEEQLKKCQDMYSFKAREVENLNFKRQRAEEELEAVRVKYERAKRNDSTSNQTGDQILEEANRQMKETLTCPSCKVRPKDCIMLKCYHLFCETCVKTMYDTRQRKCPKCTCNFGANDYHRIFI
ncbi:CBN-RFP-1 protein [Caenorhabditis brenneri]|uniref:E3 ubiquitin protein ligase n=1 Tax=Caenorhabditis brenneri TaxID=135651 RepID=G0ME05_CAEBE|nr:CBN-RFP-1 protein [Caenorhabditis brenneri]